MSLGTDRSGESGRRERLRIRSQNSVRPTAGLAPGNVQANLVILPQALAYDFLRFAQANPKPCPVLAVSEPGDPRLPGLGADLDVRTDLPRYRVWRGGELVEEPADVRHVWRDDLVTFALGCSFSFEQALADEGIELRHLTCGTNVPMYRTSIPCVPARCEPTLAAVTWSSRLHCPAATPSRGQIYPNPHPTTRSSVHPLANN